MTTKRASCLTSIAWVGVISLIGIFVSPKHRSAAYTKASAAYTKARFDNSNFAKWVSLPPEASGVFAELFAGFDTNYRSVVFSHAEIDPTALIQQSINLNSQYSGDEILWLNDRLFSLDALFAVFIYNGEAIPDWWLRPYPGTKPVATIAFWERGGYGYGYLVVTEPLIDRVRILQFSQQHLNHETLEKAFSKKSVVEQADDSSSHGIRVR